MDALSSWLVIAPNQSLPPMDRIKYLLLRFLREEATPAEQAELEAWAAEGPVNRALLEELQDPALVAEALAKLDQLHRQEAWARVERHALEAREKTLDSVESYATAHRPAAVVLLEDHGPNRRRLLVRWMAAAVIIVLLGTGAWWITRSRLASVPPIARTTKPADIAAPVRSRATLTLAGGRQVALDSISNGQLAIQGQTTIQKLKNGQIAYIPSSAGLQGVGVVQLYNTLSNPRGSQVVTLTLSDGTKVWLNAESSIRYPAVFMGGDRAVEMTGEAYFEVATNASQPFKVTVKGQEEVDVLGTSFNINAYDDEKMVKTTLLTGSVRVAATTIVPSVVGVNTNNGKPSVVLKPGEQAELSIGVNMGNSGGKLTVDDHANVEDAVAWKNGRFAFDRADLPTVMRQLARWYNVDVSYEGAVPQRQFSGRIGKSLTLDQVLKGLTKARVHYTIESGNRLVIRP